MWKKVAIGIAALLAVLVLVVALQPAAFRVERSATLPAAPEKVFPLVADFHAWARWSPWEKLDPNLQRTFEGAASGTGAIYAWSGNDQAGKGRMTIVESTPSSRLLVKLEFIEPFPATNQTEFTFTQEGAGTKVTWTMTGENGFAGKAFGLFFDMDGVVGKDFEAGLAKLGEAAAAP